jgi:hypothetical protein
VICDSIYWDKEGREKTDYAPGEFERLFVVRPESDSFTKMASTYWRLRHCPHSSNISKSHILDVVSAWIIFIMMQVEL